MEKLIIFAALGYPGPANPSLPAIPATWEELVESAVAACAGRREHRSLPRAS